MNITYTQEQINTIVQLMNSLQVSGVDNCMRIAEVVRIMNNPQSNVMPESSAETSNGDENVNAE